MSIVGRLIEGVRAIGRTRAAAPGGRRTVVRARYDAAQTNHDNRRHWALADGLSADAAASPAVRRTLRNRARYEVANNSYARGIVLTLANDCVGTGPRLQLMGISGDDARFIERSFVDWARTVDLAEKLRCMRVAMAEDGEAFALLTSNAALATPVQLDLKLIEADQVSTPGVASLPVNAVDGIVFDAAGNAVEYHVLTEHPGSPRGSMRQDYDRIPVASMIHLFRPDRPGQRRGVPEITPAIPLFAQLRRYTLAVIAAAETAADYAGIVYTDAPAGGEADQVEPMDTIELEKRALLTMPGGWKMEQMRAEQPTTTYGEFKHEILNEIARCLNMPFSIDRRDLINDDLGAITLVPRKLGRGAGLKINDVFWTVFLNHAAFFTAANKNLLTGADTALSIDGLTKAEQAFLEQVDPDGKPLGVMPAIVLAPPSLSAIGTQLFKSLELRETTANAKYPVANPHQGKFRVEISRYLSNPQYPGNSSKAWYLLADPNDLPAIEVVFLNGQEAPVIETAEADFATLGVQMRGYHDFGVALQEPRAGLKAKGEA
ncbi:MAG: phage portal protein [Planctomycetes bacterium]|nr:phage portal protein [Planctomycetota bacterium]